MISVPSDLVWWRRVVSAGGHNTLVSEFYAVKRLNPTHLSYGLLAAIGESGASTTQLVEMLSRGHMYHPWPASQVYAEPKRLLAWGWVTSEKQPAKTRRRTVYRLTNKGRRALRQHLRQPAGWPRIQHDAAQRLFA